jgi:hypothetical protein
MAQASSFADLFLIEVFFKKKLFSLFLIFEDFFILYR